MARKDWETQAKKDGRALYKGKPAKAAKKETKPKADTKD